MMPLLLACRLASAVCVLADARAEAVPSLPPLRRAAECVADRPIPGAPGTEAISRRPTSVAFQLLTQGRDHYRARRFDEAETAYRAAIAADLDFLGPRLNLATAACLRGRFSEAVEEASALVQIAYVPWARAVLEAADLASLRTRPEWGTLREHIREAGLRWGQALEGALFFVARTADPVRVGGVGQLVLDPKQEVFAWQPRTGRFLQVTAEDGRVLAALPSPDGRRVLYVRGEKLIRDEPAGPAHFRGLVVRVLDLRTMTIALSAEVPGDTLRVDLDWSPGPAAIAIPRADSVGPSRLEAPRLILVGSKFVPAGELARRGRASRPHVALTGEGPVAGPTARSLIGACALAIGEAGGKLFIKRGQRRIRGLAIEHGAGLFGLPFAR